MAQEALLEVQLREGLHLLDLLESRHFPTLALFWLYEDEGDKWYLYLVSPLVDEVGALEGYRELNAVRAEMPQTWIGTGDVRLVSPRDRVAKAMMEFGAQVPQITGMPSRIRGRSRGDVYVSDAYYYAPRPPAPSAAVNP